MTAEAIALIDLAAQRRRLGSAVDDAILQVVGHGEFIMGPEVATLEARLAEFCGARHAISCASGTAALAMVLMAKGVHPGQAVLVPTFTFAATAEVVASLGATPVLVDVDKDTFNLDGASLARGVATARAHRLDPVGVIAVDLFGLPADYATIEASCEREGLWLLCDAAQSFGATCAGRKVGTIGLGTATSFFPVKPLGCYGDGGAVFTHDDELAAIIRSLRVHGQGSHKYDCVRIGMNGRLDTIQAAVLLEKLKIFPEEIVARERVAKRYNGGLRGVAAVPDAPEGRTSVWAHYTLRLGGCDRERLTSELKQAGIPTAVYYPKPLHLQTAYRGFPVAGNGLPVAERLAAEVVSLPMHPYLSEELQDRIVVNVRDAVTRQRGAAA